MMQDARQNVISCNTGCPSLCQLHMPALVASKITFPAQNADSRDAQTTCLSCKCQTGCSVFIDILCAACSTVHNRKGSADGCLPSHLTHCALPILALTADVAALIQRPGHLPLAGGRSSPVQHDHVCKCPAIEGYDPLTPWCVWAQRMAAPHLPVPHTYQAARLVSHLGM